MAVEKKILVIGGAGAAGSLIVNDLIRHLPGCQVDIGSRSAAQAGGVPQRVGKVRIDLDDEVTAKEVIKNYDLVILALGPFQLFGHRPQKICCEAGVDCIDINDELHPTQEIFKLDLLAREKGARVLTGMGMCPGLTTLLLLSVLKRVPGSKKNLRLRLLLGTYPRVGPASVQTLFTLFQPEVSVIRDGKFCHITVEDDKKPETFCFPHFDRPVETVLCPSTEAWTLQNSPEADMSEIENFDVKIHKIGMKSKKIASMRKSAWLKKSKNLKRMSKIFPVLNPLVNFMIGKKIDSSAVAECVSNGNAVRAYVTGFNSSEMTGRFASIIAELFIREKIFQQPGVHCFESTRLDEEMFGEALKTRNLEIVFESNVNGE